MIRFLPQILSVKDGINKTDIHHEDTFLPPAVRCFLFVTAILFSTGTTSVIWAQPPDTLWTYTYATSINDEARSIASTADGGLVVGGNGLNPDSVESALLIRLDSNGHQQWVRGYEIGFHGIAAIGVAADGGYVLTGGDWQGFGALTIVKADSNGEPLWSRRFNYNYVEDGVSVAQTADSGVAVLTAGDYTSFPDIDLVRLNSRGDSLWVQAYGGAAEDHGGVVLALETGGFLIAGSQGHQAWVFETDNQGAILWSTIFGHPTLTERLYGAAVMPNGDFVVAGMQTRDAFTFNPYVACVSASGDTLWTRTFANLGPAYLYGVAVLPNSQIVLGGRIGTQSRDGDYLTILVSPQGDTVWSAPYGTSASDQGYAMCLNSDGGIAMAGFRHPHLVDGEDIWVVRTESIYSQAINPARQAIDFRMPLCYPNPFNGSAQIHFALSRHGVVSLSVYDLAGRFVKCLIHGTLEAGVHDATFDGRDLPSGCYFYTIVSANQFDSGKLFLLK